MNRRMCTRDPAISADLRRDQGRPATRNGHSVSPPAPFAIQPHRKVGPFSANVSSNLTRCGRAKKAVALGCRAPSAAAVRCARRKRWAHSARPLDGSSRRRSHRIHPLQGGLCAAERRARSRHGCVRLLDQADCLRLKLWTERASSPSDPRELPFRRIFAPARYHESGSTSSRRLRSVGCELSTVGFTSENRNNDLSSGTASWPPLPRTPATARDRPAWHRSVQRNLNDTVMRTDG